MDKESNKYALQVNEQKVLKNDQNIIYMCILGYARFSQETDGRPRQPNFSLLNNDLGNLRINITFAGD